MKKCTLWLGLALLLAVLVLPNYSYADKLLDSKGKYVEIDNSSIIDDVQSNASKYMGKYYFIFEPGHGTLETCKFVIDKSENEMVITETQHAGLPYNKEGDTFEGVYVKYHKTKHGKLDINKNKFKYIQTLYDDSKRSIEGEFVVFKYKNKSGKDKPGKGFVILNSEGKIGMILQKY